MTTVPAAVVALLVLSAAGLAPVVVLVGPRWVTIPLAPLGGAVIAGMSATGFLAAGGTFMGWFVGLAVLGAVSAILFRWRRPLRQGSWPGPVDPTTDGGHRVLGALAAVCLVGACAWSLRALATPTVGFDARALWLMRSGWFLQSHHQLLVDMRSPSLVLTQSAYPPLVSAAAAVSASVTGNTSVRLAVVVIALLNTCALLAAAFAVVDLGRRAAARPASGTTPSSIAPAVVGLVSAVLLVLVAFGVTEPFMTNGYADPIWSLAAVGAIAFGMQGAGSRSDQGAALVLVLVAGLSKDEGAVTAVGIILLMTARALIALPAAERRRRWRPPAARALVALVLVGSWPAAVRALHARGVTSTLSPATDWFGRARATEVGLSPYLHVLVLAVPLAIVGGLLLSPVRRRIGAANDGWAWAGLAWGLVAIAGALVTGTGAIRPWILSTVHRVTEFPVLGAWWIVAVWAVVASAALPLQGLGSPPRGAQRMAGETTPAVTDTTVAAGEDDTLGIGVGAR